jgi:uncharacterized membrane protein YphA (DoxX/SURF4 family)
MTEAGASARESPPATARFARSSWLFGRLLGLVFVLAFGSLHLQLEGLMGERGITPAARILEVLAARGDGFWDVPTLAWWVGASDGALHALCVAGELAGLALLLGVVPGLASLLAALLYLSLVSISGGFLAFQWDALLIEAGALASLILPWQLVHRPSACIEPPRLARWALYLLIFRLMFLSGVVKLASGDASWASLTALEHHYWTQPLPGPLSWPVHQLPSWVHRASTLTVFVIELVLPLAIALGYRGRRAAFVGFALLMGVIALSGNYGFFNLLAFALCVPLVDDGALERVPGLASRVRASALGRPVWRRRMRFGTSALAVALLALGALQTLASLGAGRAVLEPAWPALGAVRPFYLVNGYGLFAVMTVLRREIRVEGSLDGREWREYVFAHKPGDPTELPGLSQPHMPRLDWQLWFAALGGYRDSPWLSRFQRRLLEAEPAVLALLAHDPFDGQPPRYVRAVLYDYRFGDVALWWETDAYWRVERIAPYGPTLQRRR